MICGESGAVVFGAEHTRAVEKAQQLCSQLSNVYFLQADLKHLPLEPGSFDFVFSIGVMLASSSDNIPEHTLAF